MNHSCGIQTKNNRDETLLVGGDGLGNTAEYAGHSIPLVCVECLPFQWYIHICDCSGYPLNYEADGDATPLESYGTCCRSQGQKVEDPELKPFTISF